MAVFLAVGIEFFTKPMQTERMVRPAKSCPPAVRRGAPKACGGPHLSMLAILLQPTVSYPNPVDGVAKMQE